MPAEPGDDAVVDCCDADRWIRPVDDGGGCDPGSLVRRATNLTGADFAGDADAAVGDTGASTATAGGTLATACQCQIKPNGMREAAT